MRNKNKFSIEKMLYRLSLTKSTHTAATTRQEAATVKTRR